jgi:PAS domain S-box-containing protein
MTKLGHLTNAITAIAAIIIASGILLSLLTLGDLQADNSTVLLSARRQHESAIFAFALSLLQTASGFALLALALSLQSHIPEIETGRKKLLQIEEDLTLSLNEARKKERALIEKAVDVICVIDVNCKIVSVSRSSQAAWGYSPDELQQRPLTEILVSDKTDDILGSILGAAKSIDRVVFDCNLKKANGELLDVVWTGHWSASDGGLFCIVHDITERKRAEDLVKSSEERLRLTLEGLPAGVLLFSCKKQIEFANRQAARLLGFEAENLTGMQLRDLIEGELAAAQLDERETGNPGSVETTARRQDGSKFPVEVSFSEINASEGKKLLVVFLDKTAQHELRRLKQEFTAMVVHDLRTPLSAVYGLMGLLEEGILGPINERGRSIVLHTKKDLKRVLKLINELLEIERISSGHFTLECSALSIQGTIRQSVAAVASLAGEKRLRFDFAESSDLPSWGDEERVVQVLVNILANAIKFSPEESTVQISFEELDHMTKVVVTDRGPGIPPEKTDRIFEKFEQLNLQDSRKLGGAGLGLAICKEIIKAHGGDIGVISKLGEGSSFWFTLPSLPELRDQATVSSDRVPAD